MQLSTAKSTAVDTLTSLPHARRATPIRTSSPRRSSAWLPRTRSACSYLEQGRQRGQSQACLPADGPSCELQRPRQRSVQALQGAPLYVCRQPCLLLHERYQPPVGVGFGAIVAHSLRSADFDDSYTMVCGTDGGPCGAILALQLVEFSALFPEVTFFVTLKEHYRPSRSTITATGSALLRCRWCPLSLWALELASDLSSDGISGIADSYMAQTDSRGNVIRSNPFQDAHLAPRPCATAHFWLLRHRSLEQLVVSPLQA